MVLFRSLGITLAMLACLGSLNAQAAQTRVFEPVADTVIYFDGEGGTRTSGDSNARGENLSVGQDASGTVRRSLLRFDLSSILPGSVVHSAELRLFETRSRANYDVSLHRVLAGWGEGGSNGGSAGGYGTASAGDATWLRSVFPDTAWSAAGGDFVQEHSATTLVGFAPATYSWSSGAMASDIQSWVDTPSGNHGWILIGQETINQNAKLFGSRESAAMPILTLQVSPVPEPSMVATLLAGLGVIGWRLRDRSSPGRR